MAVRATTEDRIKDLDENTPLLRVSSKLETEQAEREPNLCPSSESESVNEARVIKDEINKIETKLKDFNQMRVLIVGKSGVGKSSFLNSLYQVTMAQVGRVKPETSAVTEYTLTTEKDAVKVIVYDTPGFGTNVKENKKYIKEIRKTCELVDVIFLCIRLDDQLRTEDKLTIALLAKEFKEDFWKKLLIVFTRANMVQPMGQYKEETPKNYLREVRDELKGEVVKSLQRERITVPPFVIAGAPEYTSQGRMIPNIDDDTSDESEMDWLPIVASKILESGCSDNGKAVLLKSGWGKWARASAGSGVGLVVGTAVGTGILAVGVATLAIPGLGVAAICVGGTVIVVSFLAGGTSTAACGTTAVVKKMKKNRKVEKVLSKMTTKTE